MQMIDLSQFVNKEVVVTLKNGEVYDTKICNNYKQIFNSIYSYQSTIYPYTIEAKDCTYTYTKDGKHYIDYSPSDLDIVDIQLKVKKTMPLSEHTVNRLAEALAPEAVEYITSSEEYTQFMAEMTFKFLTEKMGEMDRNLQVELSTALGVDKLVLFVR
jgi:small nuclear ribonucleoprotein (snRNP)-like protein